MAQASTTKLQKWVYRFGDGKAEGDAGLVELLGGKGANLAEMSKMGLPVPPGFTITTDVCSAYYENGRSLPEGLADDVRSALEGIGQVAGAVFGDAVNPLLVSVRSGARASMPGMMDTVLNLGLNDETVEGLKRKANDARFAFDSYRRFIQMYGDVVMGVDHHLFEDILETYKNLNGFETDTELAAEDWQEIVEQYKALIAEELGHSFPQDPFEQVWGAVGAVFGSWQNARAITYRQLHAIPHDWGTAVTIQAMVFGNMGESSATGVAFTRDPSTGEDRLYGEYLVNAQGEDVVAGIRTPQPLGEDGVQDRDQEVVSLQSLMPEAYGALKSVCQNLESHYRDMQDVEFTVQNGKLWMLQTRRGKRSTSAAFKIAADMVDEGLITKEDAINRINPQSLDQLLHPTLDPDAPAVVIAKGLPASPGAATGAIVFDADEAEKLSSQGVAVILTRVETSPEDVHGMHAAEAILTARGGMTSHAAVVARGMGRPCVCGVSSLIIDQEAGTLHAGEVRLKEGDIITLDGSAGTVMQGEIPKRQPELSGDFAKIMGWADEIRRLRVRANAETPRDVKQARDFGAEGIGLCRTEHMFFDAERIQLVREMILADDEKGRRAALDKILPFQRADFVEIFDIMRGLPVTIRLLDPPLHEFLPHDDHEIETVAKALGAEPDKLRERLQELREFNPMLGHRGCRLAISYPEICEMQTRAIIEAVIDEGERTGDVVQPEIMVPLVSVGEEFDFLKAVIDKTADTVQKEKDVRVHYHVGTMIELPRAALRASEIAERADFFSFGTNDLTQTVFGLSRDDAGPILSDYLRRGILKVDPFVTIDKDGVGELVRLGTTNGRSVREDIKIGICGEHGGDPESVKFCDEIGLDYVSCSPFRVPVARLAAAQASLAHLKG